MKLWRWQYLRPYGGSRAIARLVGAFWRRPGAFREVSGSWKDDAKNEHVVGVVYGELVASVSVRAKGERQIVFFVLETFPYGGAQSH